MTIQTRNLILILVGVALLLCCCTASCSLLVPAYSFLRDRVSGHEVQVEVPVTVITRVVTPTARATDFGGAREEGTPTPATRIPTAVSTAPAPETAAPPATPEPAAAASPGPGGPDAEIAEVRVEMPARDLRELALRLRPGVTDIPIVVNATPPAYREGDAIEFWVSNNDTMEHRKITAILRYVNDRVNVWVEQGVNLNRNDLKKSADRFATKTYPTNREFFGSEWTPGVDNDVRLNILHARDLGRNVAGYYSSADEFSNLVNPYSNEKEMFYISADSDSARPNTPFYDGTLAHEFQHMIHWYHDRNEDSWVNEGMSELAGFLNGFDPGGFDIAYSEQPDTQLTTWADPAEGNAEHYGASYLFVSYFLDRFGEDLTKAVVASPRNGAAGFDEALEAAGRSERFDDVFADWLIANYVDQPDFRDGRYGYKEIDPYAPVTMEDYRRYPVSGKAQVSQYGADYIRLRGGQPVTVEFEGQSQVKLVDAQTRGLYSWWSNRGDDADATLTGAFDLRGVSAATLNFSIWYDIEEGWDYAYVEVSTDGGKRWQILPARTTTEENPVGNAFGPGWTGVSGGGSAPRWIEEQVDLTPFAGQEVLIRFEYVTDDAVNEPGVLLDDIAIPELGYAYDGETGAAGWQAEGWILTDNTLPQRWLVQLLEIGQGEIVVQRMEIGADGRGRLTTRDLKGLQEAVLVISALTPVTTEPASYNYALSTP